MDNRSIGIFDSGVGGLSVLNRLVKLLPNEKYVYIGDTFRMPYGVKSVDVIREYSKKSIEFISKENLKAVVIACNTVSSCGLQNLYDNFDFPIIDVITPGSVDAVCVTVNGKIAVTGTNATINSGLYKKYINDINPDIEVRSIAFTDLVPAIEGGHSLDEIGKKIIEKYIDDFGDFDYDTLVFGCTHYPLAKSNFKKIFQERNKNVFLVDPAHNTALKLRETLEQLNAFSDFKEGSIKFFTTSEPERFKKLAIEHTKLKKEYINPVMVDLDEELKKR
ncbi:glutamate racemase [Peptoniphilus sp. ING2-D1G]|nr:glutamate racemase [Peptoniphilus sp. ING2-D1G]